MFDLHWSLTERIETDTKLETADQILSPDFHGSLMIESQHKRGGICKQQWASFMSLLLKANELEGWRGQTPHQLLTGGTIGRLIRQSVAIRVAGWEEKKRKSQWTRRGQRGVEASAGWREVERSDLNGAWGGTLRWGWHEDRSASIRGLAWEQWSCNDDILSVTWEDSLCCLGRSNWASLGDHVARHQGRRHGFTIVRVKWDVKNCTVTSLRYLLSSTASRQSAGLIVFSTLACVVSASLCWLRSLAFALESTTATNGPTPRVKVSFSSETEPQTGVARIATRGTTQPMPVCRSGG